MTNQTNDENESEPLNGEPQLRGTHDAEKKPVPAESPAAKPKRVLPPPGQRLTLKQALAFTNKHFGDALQKLADEP